MDVSARRLGPMEIFNLSVLGFGLAALSTSLAQIILPIRVMDIAPDSMKNTYLGVLTFAGLATAMLAQVAVGFCSDRTTLPWGRRRPYIGLGAVLSVLFMAGMGAMTNYIWLIAMVVLVQMSSNIAQTPYDAMVKDQVPYGQRGRMSSVRAVSGAAGAVLLVLVTGVLMDRHVIKERDIWLWLSLAIPTFFVVSTAVWTIITVRDERIHSGRKEIKDKERYSSEDTHPQLGLLLIAGFFFTLAGGILQTYMLFFLKDVVGLENPASAVGIMAVVVGTTVIITLYPAGFLADRIGRRPLLLFSAILGGIGSILLFFAQNIEHIVSIGILLGVAVGVFMTAGRALITDMVSENKAGQEMGIANFALLAGLAVSKLGGIVIDYLNSYSNNAGYYGLLVVCAASFLIGAIVVNFLRRRDSERLFASS